ncbi:GNAT family N-acetyltransferase [Bernardetia sp.]|uniref:GNAT family N-acetyltransferase n=1 Tax=Bernardetia sp. TaxID=1937974 RepID=UPI0025C4E6D8|nr:GNAT family N-acetyltransferase [Bernardetia sp.]
MISTVPITLPVLEDSERLNYEQVDWHNYRKLLSMFEEDKSIFVMNDYKSIDQLEEYIDYQLNFAQFSFKRGAADWFYKNKITNEYIGIFNLYDLSTETINDNHKRCTIGFATNKKYREKYYTLEAIETFKDAIINQLGKTYILSYTTKENIATIELLQRAGFQKSDGDYIHKEYVYYEFFV